MSVQISIKSLAVGPLQNSRLKLA